MTDSSTSVSEVSMRTPYSRWPSARATVSAVPTQSFSKSTSVMSRTFGSMSSANFRDRSEEHTSELQSPCNLVCRLLLEKKKNTATRDQQRQKRQQDAVRPQWRTVRRRVTYQH